MDIGEHEDEIGQGMWEGSSLIASRHFSADSSDCEQRRMFKLQRGQQAFHFLSEIVSFVFQRILWLCECIEYNRIWMYDIKRSWEVNRFDVGALFLWWWLVERTVGYFQVLVV